MLDVVVVVSGGLGFAAGLLVGLALAEACSLILTGHTRGMDNPLLSAACRLWKAQSLRLIGVGAVLLAVTFSALTGFMNIQNSRADESRLDCFTRYYVLSGMARDERAAQITEGLRSELTFYRATLRALRSGQSTSDEVAGALVDRIDTIEESLEVRAENRYPDPNLCKNEVKKEGDQ